MHRDLMADFDLLNEVGKLTEQEIDRTVDDDRDTEALTRALESFSQSEALRGKPTKSGLVEGSGFRAVSIPVVEAKPKRRESRDPRFLGTFSPILRMTKESE